MRCRRQAVAALRARVVTGTEVPALGYDRLLDEEGRAVADVPVLTSPSTVESLWQEYRIYDDRLEFGTLVGTMTIPVEQIESVRIAESDVEGPMRGDLQLAGFRSALEIDWANFLEHVVLDKSAGVLRRVLFTPDDVHAFVASLGAALARSLAH